MPQVADPKDITFATQGWQGGLNVRDSLAQLQPNELRRAENVTYDSAGGVSKRPGTTSLGIFGATTDRVLSSYTFYRGTSGPQVLIHVTSGALLYTNDITATPPVWATVTSGLSTTAPCSFETQNSKCYFAEGTRVGQWDGVAYTQITAAPAGINFLRVWKDTMWAAGTNPDRVYSSSAGDPTSWPAANWVDILHGDGDYISGLASDGLYLIVAKHRRIQVITDPALFTNRTADWEKGAESHNGWLHLEDKLYFLSRLGVCWWQGDSSARLISFKIDPLFDPHILDFSQLWKVQGYLIGSRAGWAVTELGSSTPNNLVLEYYPRLGPIYQISGNIGPGPWSMHRMPVSTFTTVRQGNTEALYGGHPTANKFMKCFDGVGTDDGQPFVGTVEGAPMNLQSPILTKYLRRMHVVGMGTMAIQLKRNYRQGVYKTVLVDFTSAGEIWNVGNWNDSNWGPDPIIKEHVFNLDGYAQVVSLCITDSDTNTGRNLLPVGTKDVQVTAGSWALYQVTFDALLLGIRSEFP